MVLAQKQIGRPVEHNRGSGYESTQLSQLIFNMEPKTYNGEKTASSKILLGKVVIYLQKTETRSMPITLY
jgi:hypothetical protein